MISHNVNCKHKNAAEQNMRNNTSHKTVIHVIPMVGLYGYFLFYQNNAYQCVQPSWNIKSFEHCTFYGNFKELYKDNNLPWFIIIVILLVYYYRNITKTMMSYNLMDKS